MFGKLRVVIGVATWAGSRVIYHGAVFIARCPPPTIFMILILKPSSLYTGTQNEVLPTNNV